MAPVEFRLDSRWRVRGDVGHVYDIISEPLGFVRWWPRVYLDVEEIRASDGNGIGRVLNLHTRGWLPYTLRWMATTTVAERPGRLALEAHGDLEGRGEWCLRQDGEWTLADFTSIVVASKPWMRYVAPLLGPLFAANHRWAMRQGQRGLEGELARSTGS